MHLFRVIEQRVHSIIAQHPDWPCRRGCDACCRRLARVPELTAPELALLSSGLEALDGETQAAVLNRIRELSPAAPVICPFLDQQQRACLLYEYRPAACRTYGFYVERDQGLYCDIIRDLPNEDVVWGNQSAIDRKLDAFGPRIDLKTWFSSREQQRRQGTTAPSRA